MEKGKGQGRSSLGAKAAGSVRLHGRRGQGDLEEARRPLLHTATECGGEDFHEAWHRDHISPPYGELWRQTRKICRLELSPRRILSFRAIHEEEAARLVRIIALSSSSSSSAPSLVNLSVLLGNYVTDTTVHIIMDERFRERDALLQYIDEAVRPASGLTLPDLFPFSRLARVLSTTLRRAEVFLESLFEFMDRVISEHLEKRSCQGERVVLWLQAEGNLQFELTMGVIKVAIFVSSCYHLHVMYCVNFSIT
ncbi:hypothetical protein E2562_000256 [Oryza meyeriana var. granulata]|uniref:Cytochrome P450 n=1 Tax=Oryza meyeriana var. granulata TaxID=110450 RepID=A0A6G1CP05_9ORYZ|nr:hypothetical protein E2562_000256 [Oryza meyeriana var. granulata]